MDRPTFLKEMIQSYREKIRLYESIISEFERELGGPAPVASGPTSNGSDNKNSSTDPVSTVRSFQFFNKSQPEAAKLLLEFVGHPLLTQQIVEGIEKGGVTVGGKTAKDKKLNIYSILRRSADFVRWKKDTWGLPAWPGAPKQSESSDTDDEIEKSEKVEKGAD
jgi:hypothetical protein